MPLGVACLAAVADRKHTELDLFDANLELWNHLCDMNDDLRSMRAFAHGPLPTFLNAELYTEYWGHMPLAKRRIGELEQQAKHYLAGKGFEEELRHFLARQTARIERKTPETVAFSVMYLDQLPFVLSQAKYLRLECGADCRIVLGGAAMSALAPEELLNAAPFVDLILTGEGEIPFEAFLDGRPPEEISGCYYRQGNTIAFAGSAVAPEDLASLPSPDFSRLISGGYFNPVPVMPVYGCRGCKWRRCRFCVHNNSFGRFRQRRPMTVALEMQEYQLRFGCRHFYIVDQYVDPFSLSELSNAILELGLDCRFQIMARTIEGYTPELLQRASRAGCCWISWGMESGSQKLLQVMNKGTTPATSLQVIRDAAAAGISNLLMMIFGSPGSDAACLNETFAFLDQAWPHIDGMTASAFVLFDQTAFSMNATKYGLQVLGGNRILEIDGKPIHDMKLRFKREQEEGRGESPLATQEIDTWERRKVWLPPLPFHGQLCCEHYLLYADAMQARINPGSHWHSA